MGRKTWESKGFAGKPLPDRLNVVVSRQALVVPNGAVVASSVGEALAIDGVETIFVIGGAALIRDVLERPDLRFVYLTRIAQRFDCDVRMTNLDALGFVRDRWDGERDAEENDVRYRIERLKRG